MDKPKWYEDLDDYTERVSNMSPEQAKAIETFRQQHPEYANGDLLIELAENKRSVTIRPKADPAFSVKYYMVEPVEELEEEVV